jgi:lipopolysaccharide exporter
MPNLFLRNRMLQQPVDVAGNEIATERGPGGRLSIITAHLRGRRFARNVALLSTGTALAQGFSILLAPVITRIYQPADLGVLGLFASFLSVAAVATCLKYELGIVSATTEREAAQLTWISMLLSLPISVVASGILFAARRFSHFGFGDLPAYSVFIMLPALFLSGIYSSLRYWALRKEEFARISKTVLAQNTARSLSQTGLGLLNAASTSLLISECIARAVGVLPLLRKAWPSVRREGTHASRTEILAALRHNRKLPIYSLPSSLLDTLAGNINVPLLIQLFGSAAGGQFALVQKIFAVPMALIATSVADAFHSRVALCAREDPAQMRALFIKTTVALLLIGMVPASLLAIAGDRVFAFVFGQNWEAAGRLAAVSTPAFLAQFVVSPLSRIVFVLRGQEFKLIYDFVILTSLIATFITASIQGFSLLKTVWIFSLVNTFGYCVYYMVLLRIIANSTAKRMVFSN